MSLVVDGLTVALQRGPLAVNLLDSVSLAVPAGESLALVGESGAGKSLLCRAVAGLLDPPARLTGGRVVVNGNRIDGLDGRRLRAGVWGRELSLLLQDPGECLDPMATMGAQLEETLTAHALGASGAIEWLRRVGLPDPAAQSRAYPHQLSGGMKQRAALALALCSGPRLLLADEPTSALDPIAKARVIELLLSLCRAQRTTLLVVTHDLHVARAMTQVAVLYAGTIVEAGPAAAVLGAPLHPYTRALIECLPKFGQQSASLPVIGGAMPPPGDPARSRGCVFAPRCGVAEEHCVHQAPPAARVSETVCACWARIERS